MPFLAAQLPERLVQLRHREGRARHVRRLGRDDRRRRVHVDHEFLGLRRDVAGRERIGSECKSGEHVDVVAHHEFLREPLGDIRRDAAGVLADEFDLLAGDGVAVLLHVELDAVVHLGGEIGELARVGQDHADLDRLLRARRGSGENDCGNAGNTNESFSHGYPPLVYLSGISQTSMRCERSHVRMTAYFLTTQTC